MVRACNQVGCVGGCAEDPEWAAALGLVGVVVTQPTCVTLNVPLPGVGSSTVLLQCLAQCPLPTPPPVLVPPPNQVPPILDRTQEPVAQKQPAATTALNLALVVGVPLVVLGATIAAMLWAGGRQPAPKYVPQSEW